MTRLEFLVGLVIFLVSGPLVASEYIRGCYYTNWSQHKSPAFLPENINPGLCTHIFIAYDGINTSSLEIKGTEANDIEIFSRLVALKSNDPSLKLYLSIGGWQTGSSDFSSVASSDGKITQFADNVITTLRSNGLDGLDVAWFYPGLSPSPASDKSRFTTLLKILKTKFAAEGTATNRAPLGLTATVASSPDYADKAYDHASIQQYVDYINVMTYDISGNWIPHILQDDSSIPNIGFNSDWTQKAAVSYWMNKGFPANKILLGLSTYGEKFELTEVSGSQDLGMGGVSPVNLKAGFIPYYEVCEAITTNSWTSKWDDDKKIQYVSGQKGKSKLWIGYNTPQSFDKKLEIVTGSNLAGVSIWSLDNDDFTGSACGLGKYPLLNAVSQALISPTTSPSTSPTTSPTTAVTSKKKSPASEEYIRGCYYTNWAQYRSGSYKFLPEDIDPTICTHIFYAFSRLDGKGLNIGPYEANDKEMWGRVIALKSQNPKLKVYLVAGGWNEGSSNFGYIVEKDSRIRQFATNMISLLRTEGFDGFDVDWEYPGAGERGSVAAHKQRFTSFLRIIREEFTKESEKTGRPSLDLIAAVSPSPYFANRAYEHSIIHRYLDFLNVMTYDLAGTWLATVQHHSALKPATTFSTDWDMKRSIKYWTDNGFPASKIVLGLSNYGRGFKIGSGSQSAPGVKQLGVGSAGPGLQQSGFLSYSEICTLIKSNGWVSKWMEEQKVPYVYGMLNGIWNWVGYDTPRSFTEKIEFVKSQGLAGAFVWSLDMDDFTGTACGLGQYPLLNTIIDGFRGSTPPTKPPTSGDIFQEVTTQSVKKSTPGDPSSFVPSCDASGFGPNPFDCTKFYQCNNGQAYSQLCVSGLAWDQSISSCNWPSLVPGCESCCT
ncbi:hypothetical protein LOTGIDRAFT_230122 [Lottia gigantea]|uniref:Uncharacterized protein n=1 Tax=Lottia gigantea TaxID=225164 RepID=V4CN43_LOTGI|nr:hypothetical protein LOTGIDRAFT_230122 [Lottia gigantea]ESP03805.1 hypothetical protein LOTGIDRAFT_230122 [Lottia gigantea]